MSEWRAYRKDLKRRAKSAMETSRQLLVAKARIIELEAEAASTELEIQRLKGELEGTYATIRDQQLQSGKLLEAERQRVADTTLKLRVLEDAVRSASKLLPDARVE